MSRHKASNGVSIGNLETKMNNIQLEQYEAAAVAAARAYTEDVYVGPDITSESLNQMVNPDLDGMVYLEPSEDTDKRVIVTLLRDEQSLDSLCAEMTPLCYAIRECVSNYKHHSAVKWLNVASVESTDTFE